MLSACLWVLCNVFVCFVCDLPCDGGRFGCDYVFMCVILKGVALFGFVLCLCAWLCLVVRCVRDALCDAVWSVCVDLFCVCASVF